MASVSMSTSCLRLEMPEFRVSSHILECGEESPPGYLERAQEEDISSAQDISSGALFLEEV